MPKPASNSPAARWPDRKTLQLCAQVERALALALAGCGDEVLQGVTLESVRPGPDGSILAVTVLPPGGPGASGAREVLAALERARGRLRAEIASAIHRQRVPELVFRFAAPGIDPPPISPGAPKGAEGGKPPTT